MTTVTKTLALETSTRLASIALLDGDDIVASRALRREVDTARELTPTLGEMLESVGWQPADLELIGVSIGPGSFTGLRIGVTTAKTLAYATGSDVVAVDALRAIAAQVPDDDKAGLIRVLSDAGRGQAYTATYAREHDGTLVLHNELSLITRDIWLDTLDASVIETGSVLDRWCRELDGNERLATARSSGVRLADNSCWTPTAETVGQLAVARHAAGQTDDFWQLVPRYVRRSAAEEVWEAKHGGGN